MNELCLLQFYIFIADNGFNPVWNETSEFEIANPAVAFIRFVVKHALFKRT